ncbi:MAG: T9SS type A sorting domain-containing protein [Bacteroidota bacterium]
MNFKKIIIALFLLLPSLSFSQVVFSDIAGIVYNRCGSCHHAGGHASSLEGYTQIVQDAYYINAYLSINKMPPWSPDTTYSRFTHERIITTTEKQAILDWINQGLLPGDTTLAPIPPTYSPYQLAGTPDLELSIGAFASNAISNDAYNCFSLPTGLTQNRIIRAFEIIPGNESIVHHVIVNVDTIGNTVNDLSGTCYNASGNFSIGGYAPGSAATVFPSTSQLKMGIVIKAGSKIVLQMHYPAGSFGQMDSTKIRIYFYPQGTTGVRPVYVSTPLQNWNLSIPANSIQNYSATYPPGAATLPTALSVIATFPHSHKLATKIVNYAYTAGDTIPLIKINNWDFNWQGYYTFKKPVKIPAGYKLFGRHTYDNTTANPFNPHNPPINVYAGFSTSDEMFFDSFQYLNYLPGDETISLDSLLANDPLLTAVHNPQLNNFKETIYPNPAKNEVTFSFINTKIGPLTIRIHDVNSELLDEINIQTTSRGLQEVKWLIADKIKSGIYFYELNNGEVSSKGKLMIVK